MEASVIGPSVTSENTIATEGKLAAAEDLASWHSGRKMVVFGAMFHSLAS